MKSRPTTKTTYDTMGLIDHLLDIKLDSDSFATNEKIIDKVSDVIDQIANVEGYSLLSITKDNNRKLILLASSGKTTSCFTWSLKNSIDTKVDAEIYETNLKSNLYEVLQQDGWHSSEAYASACIVETLNGYAVNLNQLAKFKDFKQTDPMKHSSFIVSHSEIEHKDVVLLGKRTLRKLKEEKIKTKEIIENHTNKVCKDIPFVLKINNIYPKEKGFISAKITDVWEVAGVRWYRMSVLRYDSEGIGTANYFHGFIVGKSSAGVTGDDMNVKQIGNSYCCLNSANKWSGTPEHYKIDNLERIPFNLIDTGRCFLGFRTDTYDWHLLISSDPMVDKNYLETFEKDIDKFLLQQSLDTLDMEETVIEKSDTNTSMEFDSYKDNLKQEENAPTGRQLVLKTIKKMADEYNYIVKKNTSIGEDVTVTDAIKYNHNEGKIIYNDFSIAVDDEWMKSKLHEMFQRYLVDFYRDSKTEQQVLDEITNNFFSKLESRLKTLHREPTLIPLKLNEAIDVSLEIKVSTTKKEGLDNKKPGASYYYLNGQRFNKNEIIIVLKEMTCYRNQEEANSFIRNIGRLGLSVYIGITTGYEICMNPNVEEEEDKIYRIFRFKKLKGRSNYQLVLDGSYVPIKGKKLINILYNDFIEEYVPGFEEKIPKLILESSQSAKEYIKYKVLIDSSYNSFKEKAKEFLTRKIDEVGAKETKYFNRKARKILDAIEVDGASNNKYIIAYDTKDSYVFISPEYDEENEYFKDGKYICMIDQSNIKSNISYDTVVAKLLALKNDSSIAHTIYNLEEEL
jgi:hypothetical protein